MLQTYRKAIAYADLLAQREPENAQWQHELALALSGYAWTLLTAEPDDLRNPTEALTLAQRAIQLAELMPQTARAALLDTLAMAHHLTGNHARAIQVAEQGLALVPASDQKTIQLRQELETHLAAFRAAQQQRSSSSRDTQDPSGNSRASGDPNAQRR